jgi:hypothetical protein
VTLETGLDLQGMAGWSQFDRAVSAFEGGAEGGAVPPLPLDSDDDEAAEGAGRGGGLKKVADFPVALWGAAGHGSCAQRSHPEPQRSQAEALDLVALQGAVASLSRACLCPLTVEERQRVDVFLRSRVDRNWFVNGA